MQINLESGSRAGPVKSLAAADNLAAQDALRQHFTPVADAARGSRACVLGMRVWVYLAACVSALLLLAPPAQVFFAGAGMRWAYILSMSFCLSFSLTPLAALLARRCGILDVPDARKLHGRPTPLLGGAAVFIGFAASLLANAILVPELVAILTGAMILFVVGVFDDWREVPAGIKLSIQIVCTVIVMSSGVVLRVVPDTLGTWSWIGNMLLTVVWVIGITNAMNFFDGMDGLAAGMGAIIAFFLGAVAFQTKQPFLGWIALAVMGGCLGFLPYNFKHKGTASIFLGDAGSTVIGFVLACIAVYGDWAEGRPLIAFVSPLLIFWLLIFDMVHITVDRILTGKVLSFRDWIEYVGKDHLHHRLADALGSRRNSVLCIYLMSLCMGVSALMLRNAGPADAVLLIVQACIIVVLVTILERRGRLLPKSGGST